MADDSRIDDILTNKKTEDILKKQNIALEKRKALKNSFNIIFSGDDGANVLEYLMNTCGFHKTSIVCSSVTGEFLANQTIYNEARRAIYLELRAFLSNDILKKIENKGESK